MHIFYTGLPEDQLMCFEKVQFCTTLVESSVSVCVFYITDVAGASSDGRSKEEENPLRSSTNKAQPKPCIMDSLPEWKISASVRQASPEV